MDASNTVIKRRRKLIKPRLQARLVLSFLGVSILALVVQLLLLAQLLSEVANALPDTGDELSIAVPGLLLKVVLISIGVLLPLVLGFGILITHRIAGPVYRFERHLETAAQVVDPGPCRLREGDELQELCSVLNRGLEGAYQRGVQDAATDAKRRAA